MIGSEVSFSDGRKPLQGQFYHVPSVWGKRQNNIFKSGSFYSNSLNSFLCSFFDTEEKEGELEEMKKKKKKKKSKHPSVSYFNQGQSIKEKAHEGLPSSLFSLLPLVCLLLSSFCFFFPSFFIHPDPLISLSLSISTTAYLYSGQQGMV